MVKTEDECFTSQPEEWCFYRLCITMKKKIFKVALTSVFLLTPFLVWLSPQEPQALSPFELNQHLTGQYQAQKKQYLQVLSSYQQIKDDFVTARQRYLQAQNAANSNLFLKKIQTYFPSAIDTMISYLETAQKRIENSSALSSEEKQALIAEIQTDINYLQKQKHSFASVSDMRTAKENARTLKDYWLKNRLRARKWSCQILQAKVENILTRLENTANRLEEKIKSLQAEDQDIDELLKEIANFRTKISQAREELNAVQEKCNGLADSGNNLSFSEVHQQIKQVNQLLREAHRDLTAIARKLTKYRHKQIKVFAGTGVIHTKGSGKMAALGNGSVTGTVDPAGGGSLTIIDQNGDAQVDTNGQGHKEEIGNNEVKYTGIGTISVTGSNIIVIINGSGLDITAKGTGKVLLKGNLTYQIGGSNEWKKVLPGGVEASLSIR